MNDGDFLAAMKTYIEEMEQKIEGEWGIGLPLNDLIAGDQMPMIYAEVLKRMAGMVRRININRAEAEFLADLLMITDHHLARDLGALIRDRFGMVSEEKELAASEKTVSASLLAVSKRVGQPQPIRPGLKHLAPLR